MARTIDVPLERLPPIDEHGLLVLASPPEVWEAMLPVLKSSLEGPAAARVARGLGCSETEGSGDLGRIGSTIPGFLVTRVIEPAVLALEGQHRFARYGLVFRIEPTSDDRTLLRAETRADFPGLKGRLYRELVIGTRLHVLVVGRLLRAIRGRAERR